MWVECALLGERQRALLLMAQRQHERSVQLGFPCPLIPRREVILNVDPGDAVHMVCVTLKKTKETPSVLRGLLTILSILCPRGKLYLYYAHQETNLSSVPEGNTMD